MINRAKKSVEYSIGLKMQGYSYSSVLHISNELGRNNLKINGLMSYGKGSFRETTIERNFIF